MGKLSLALGVTLAVAGVYTGVKTLRSSLSAREVKISGGRSALTFTPSFMQQNHLTVDLDYKLNEDDCGTCSGPAFHMQDANLVVQIRDGKLSRFEGGKISHTGSFKLRGGAKTLNAKSFSITPRDDEPTSLTLTAETDKGKIVAFDLERPRGLYQANEDEIVIEGMDVLVSEGLAEELGRPELKGAPVGRLSMYGESQILDGKGELKGVRRNSYASAGLDISLSAMGSLSVASNPTAKVGTYPNGRTGLTMSTTSCNVGTINIPWNAPMQTTHPVIALNLYRLKDGRFEQVGWSWLKHGFLSTNSNGCGACQNPGTGSLLGLNCSDTYGTGNNGDRNYLGGRDEVNPFTGVWTCQGSWFSNYQNDCVRRNPGSVTLDAVDHRLDCLDSDLGNPGAQYFYEAYYITPNDINTYNNLGSREATMSWNGSSWSISTITTQLQGPAINRWGDVRSTAQPQTEGDVIVAVKTTALGGGMYHYEYAVYNHNLDRQVRTFSVPLPFGAVVQNIGFHDIDRNATNEWTAVQNSNSLVWSSPTFGNAGANPLKYSSVFNFRFDCNVPPASTTTTLGLFKPGTGTALTAAVQGPLTFDSVASYSVINGFQRGGNLQSLANSDNDRLALTTVDTGSRGGTGIGVSILAPSASVSQFVLRVESSNTLSNGGGATQVIELFNWNTETYEVMDSRPATLTDSVFDLVVASNASRFVNGSTREVLARIVHTDNLGNYGNRWIVAFDQIGYHFN